MSPRIPLGFEIQTGQPVSIPLHHTVITGLTGQSGKTTVVEGLLSRLPAGYRALVFLTKRGELPFAWAQRVQPFYRERVDWEYVQSLLEAAMRERLKFERSWIISATKGAHRLEEVYQYIVRKLEGGGHLRGLDESVWTNLRAYFEKVLPELRRHPWATTLELGLGCNVMDLTHLSEQVQALVIAACLEEVHQHGRDTVMVIPEGWAFLPQARGNPVKWAAQHVIRQGRSTGVYLWIDSQDVTTITKDVLKSVDVWILGRQREVNEVRRVLDQLPVTIKPKPQSVMTLKVGHFFVAAEDWCREVYAWPRWLAEEEARSVALGRQPVPAQPIEAPQEDDMERVKQLEAENLALRERMIQLERELKEASRQAGKVTELETALGAVRKERAAIRANSNAEREVVEVGNAMLKAFRLLRQADGVGPSSLGPPGTPLDLEQLAKALVPFLPSNGRVVPLIPLEALQHRFQEEAVERLLAQVRTLTETQRRALLWLVSTGKTARYRDVCQGLGLPTQGNGYVVFSQGMKHLIQLGFVREDTHGLSAILALRVGMELAAYDPSAEVAEQTTQHLLGLLAQGEGDKT